jgi:pyruvate kinase
MVREVSKKLGRRIGILVDLQGPEMRIKTYGNVAFEVKKGEQVIFTDGKPGDNIVSVPNGFPKKSLKIGDVVLVDDGLQEYEVIGTLKSGVKTKALGDYLIETNKGLNLPSKHIDLPSLTKDDLLRLDMAARLNVDFVALSFGRSKSDVDYLRAQMDRRGLKAAIILKVESREALDNIDELIDVSDGIMVARGDLAVEVPYEELAYWQKLIVDKCRAAVTPVIVATQMLESMKSSARPTRAEVTDVANAVLQGTDAVMLSGETASGKYPVEAVAAMNRIAIFNEAKSGQMGRVVLRVKDTELVVDAAANMIKRNHGPDIDAVIVFTETGYTARVMASYRPEMPVIAVSHLEKTANEMTLSYGISTHVTDFPTGQFQIPTSIIADLKRKKLLKKGDTVLVIHGQHWQAEGQTNAVVMLHL